HGCRADAVARDLLASIRQPFYLQSLELRVDASIGIASSADFDGSLDDLLRQADIAMYKAKARHQGALRYSADAEQSYGQLRMTAQLRYALEHDPTQLVVHYQPKVNLLSGRLAGVEALARWQHPEQGLLMPSEFLPLVQRARLQQLLTERVLERVLAELPMWQGELRAQPVAVNLPAEAVSDPTLVDCVARLLRETNTPARLLQLEITEDFLMADLDGARDVLEKLRTLGIGISIDDYGTGYSSLAYLRDLPVDELKLDRAFVAPIMHDERAAAIVRSTIELAHSLGLTMVAEGIEDIDTWHRLVAMGCDVGQGYLFGYPQPTAELVHLLGELRPTA
ncbi:MAG TPA: GGDEF domain-containing phosphodiesterase, partial [Acidothermaceae bacterium]|nr:GGDEF domain-containing phosphodiesterase [Acidothermaceae bacterium]